LESSPPNASEQERVDLGLLDLAIVLAKHKKLVLGVPLAAAALAAVISLLMPNVYTATARILPPQQNQGAAAAFLGQLRAVGGLNTASLGVKNSVDLYVGMLDSRSVADAIIERFGLQAIFEVDTLDEARRQLKNVTTISSGKEGIISIEVDDKHAERAADIANAYVEELEKLNERLAVTEAAQRRVFFEKQLRQQKDALASAEVDLKKTQEQTGLIKLDEQGKVIIDAVAHLRAQIAAKEVQIGALRSFTTVHNPDRVRAEAELKGLRRELAKLEHNTSVLETSTFVPIGKVPEAGLEYVRKLREVKYHETLFELVAKQYEVARLDEAEETSIIQVLDKALTPERKSKPKRALIVIITALLFGLLSALAAFFLEAAEKIRANPERAQRLELLKRHVRRIGP
jgi:tyrosine-protein kinase Etk/Wzc